jgi:hypothetical protein
MACNCANSTPPIFATLKSGESFRLEADSPMLASLDVWMTSAKMVGEKESEKE